MSKSSSSLTGGRHKLPLTALAVIYQTDVWSFSRPCGLPCRFLFLPYDINDFFWGISCQQTGRRRALVTIVNGSTERAKTRKICSSQSSKPTRGDVLASTPNDAPSADHQPRRQPHILAIPPAVPMGTAKVESAAEPKQIRRTVAIGREAREIPASQFGRVRALTSYGMTRVQVAELYGVTVEEIEKIVRRPDQPCRS